MPPQPKSPMLLEKSGWGLVITLPARLCPIPMVGICAKVFTPIDKRYEKILSTKVGNETIFDIMKLIESVDLEDDGVNHGKKICQNPVERLN